MKIIENLSIENNLSNSKIISILVEEALSLRGIFDKKTGRLNHSNNPTESNLYGLDEDSDDIKNNEKLKKNNKSGNSKYFDRTNLLKHINHEAFDLKTYKTFLLFLKFLEMIDEYNQK